MSHSGRDWPTCSQSGAVQKVFQTVVVEPECELPLGLLEEYSTWLTVFCGEK